MLTTSHPPAPCRHWFYEDFLRPLNPSLPSLKLRQFSIYLLHSSAQTVPLIRQYISANKGEQSLDEAFDDFINYKHRVPVCGAILITEAWDKVSAQPSLPCGQNSTLAQDADAWDARARSACL